MRGLRSLTNCALNVWWLIPVGTACTRSNKEGTMSQLATSREPSRKDHLPFLSGEFVIDGTCYKPGTMLFHPDPHFEGEFKTQTGGDILIVQYPGPTTRENPIYAGRFN